MMLSQSPANGYLPNHRQCCPIFGRHHSAAVQKVLCGFPLTPCGINPLPLWMCVASFWQS